MADEDHFLRPDPKKTHDSVAESNLRGPHYLDNVATISFFHQIKFFTSNCIHEYQFYNFRV
jgi:hypothetical protein